MALIIDFLRAAGQVFDARFTAVLLWSLALTLGLLAGLSLGAVGLVGLLPESFELPLIGAVATPLGAVRGLALGAMLLLSAFLMFPVAAMFVNLFLDRIVDAVEARHYPELAAGRPMGLAEALKGAVGFTLVVLGVNLVAMIFYLVSGPFAPLIFWAVNGYLFGREYFELVAGVFRAGGAAAAGGGGHAASAPPPCPADLAGRGPDGGAPLDPGGEPSGAGGRGGNLYPHVPPAVAS